MRQVGGQAAAAMAYHLLNACCTHTESQPADWLAKLDMALLQPVTSQLGISIKVLYLLITNS